MPIDGVVGLRMNPYNRSFHYDSFSSLLSHHERRNPNYSRRLSNAWSGVLLVVFFTSAFISLRQYVHVDPHRLRFKQINPLSVVHLTDLHIEPWFSTEHVSPSLCRKKLCRQTPLPVECIHNVSVENEQVVPVNATLLGCDPPISLLDSALDQIVATDPHLNILLLTGDLLAHFVDSSEVCSKVQATVLDRISTKLPNTLVMFSLGNNDVVPAGRVNRAELQRVTNILQQNCTQCRGVEYGTTFNLAGYYQHCEERIGFCIVSINSGLWSPAFNNSGLGNETQLAEEQFGWLNTTLQAAKKKALHVVIIGHIPPGYFGGNADWHPAHLARYIALCEEYSQIILGQFFGHHSKELIRSFTPRVGAFVSGGLTPTGGQRLGQPTKDSVNPSFKHFLIRDGSVSGLTTHYLDIASGSRQWKVMYSFKETYGAERLSSTELEQISKNIRLDSRLSSFYNIAMTGFVMDGIPDSSCDISATNSSAYRTCMERFQQNRIAYG